jgi:hypothetical protein
MRSNLDRIVRNNFAAAKFFRRLLPSWRRGVAGKLVAKAQNQPDLSFCRKAAALLQGFGSTSTFG